MIKELDTTLSNTAWFVITPDKIIGFCLPYDKAFQLASGHNHAYVVTENTANRLAENIQSYGNTDKKH